MNNWKIVCDKVKTTMDLSEMEFEKGVATLILANLGWNEFRDNIKEQYHIEDHAKGYKPDFALFPKGAEEPGIFVELKETGHKQRSKDVKQIRTYMMLTNCRFCIYFGEKMELFFIKIDGTQRSLKSVLSLDYNSKNPDGNRLLDLITYDTFDEEKLIDFCEDRIAADETVAFFTTEEGHKVLIELMAKKRQLRESAAELLPSMLTMPERKDQKVEDVTVIDPPPLPEDEIPGKCLLFTQEMKQAGGKCQLSYYPESKKYVVNKGSNLLDKSYDSCGSGAYNLREAVKKNPFLCRKDGDLYTLLEDITMPENLSSPTGASKFCWGTSRPGPKDWQDKDGKTYPSEWWK